MTEGYELVHIGLVLNPLRHIDEHSCKRDYVVVHGKDSDAYTTACGLLKQEFPYLKQEPQVYRREALIHVSTLEGKLFRVILQDVAELPEEEKLPIEKAPPEERKRAFFDKGFKR